MSSILTDKYNRNITYLRLSVTDRCNLRCRYCMPQSSFSWMPAENILSFEEVTRLCASFCRLGIKKIRLTGGEPLVRRGITRLVEKINELEGLEEICMTTNGTLLSTYARELKDAGLTHINISLDTLDPRTYASITGSDVFSRVWDSIMMALELGFPKIKINSVVIKGVTDSDILDLARLALKYPVDVRFIEFMPVGDSIPWSPDSLIPNSQIKNILEADLGELTQLPHAKGAGPAALYSVSGAHGRIGFISPLSHHFCGTCNRLRVTADGKLRLCLFSDREIDLKTPLRNGLDGQEMDTLLRNAVNSKPEGYMSLGKLNPSCHKKMSSIGG